MNGGAIGWPPLGATGTAAHLHAPARAAEPEEALGRGRRRASAVGRAWRCWWSGFKGRSQRVPQSRASVRGRGASAGRPTAAGRPSPLRHPGAGLVSLGSLSPSMAPRACGPPCGGLPPAESPLGDISGGQLATFAALPPARRPGVHPGGSSHFRSLWRPRDILSNDSPLLAALRRPRRASPGDDALRLTTPSSASRAIATGVFGAGEGDEVA